MFGTPSPYAVAAAAAGTQVRTTLWGEGGDHHSVLVFSWFGPHALVHPGTVSPGVPLDLVLPEPSSKDPTASSPCLPPRPRLCHLSLLGLAVAVLFLLLCCCYCCRCCCCSRCCYSSCWVHTASPSGCGFLRPASYGGTQPSSSLPYQLPARFSSPLSWKTHPTFFQYPAPYPTYFEGIPFLFA